MTPDELTQRIQNAADSTNDPELVQVGYEMFLWGYTEGLKRANYIADENKDTDTLTIRTKLWEELGGKKQ